MTEEDLAIKEIRTSLNKLEGFMAEQTERQKRHDPYIEQMIKREQAQDELYKSIRDKVIGTGIWSAFSLAALILWYGIKAWLKSQ
jgi:hypothetical protein